MITPIRDSMTCNPYKHKQLSVTYRGLSNLSDLRKKFTEENGELLGKVRERIFKPVHPLEELYATVLSELRTLEEVTAFKQWKNYL